jgi:cytochrome c
MRFTLLLAVPRHLCALSTLVLFQSAVPLAHAAEATQPQDDAKRGARAFKVCSACHSLEPGRNLTGPSLANVLGRKAGSLDDFQRYSDALRHSGVTWTEQSLDAWLKDPEKFIPGNDMSFQGIKNDAARRDLIAFLKVAESMAGARPMGPRMPDLKKAKSDSIVKTMRHCRDTYFVTTEDDKTQKIWEFNLRLKTDTSQFGPSPGKPVLIGVGMGGDRAAVVFSSPIEFTRFIKESCE